MNNLRRDRAMLALAIDSLIVRHIKNLWSSSEHFLPFSNSHVFKGKWWGQVYDQIRRFKTWKPQLSVSCRHSVLWTKPKSLEQHRALLCLRWKKKRKQMSKTLHFLIRFRNLMLNSNAGLTSRTESLRQRKEKELLKKIEHCGENLSRWGRNCRWIKAHKLIFTLIRFRLNLKQLSHPHNLATLNLET